MKRIPRAAKTALAIVAASGIGLATVSAATADTSALSVSLAEGSSEAQVNHVDNPELINAAIGLFSSLDGIVNNGAVPTIERTEYGVSKIGRAHV